MVNAIKIGFDFDRVLFNTEAFKRHLNKKFSGFSDSYSSARNDEGYDFRKHAKILDVEPQTVLSELKSAEKYSYEDVKLLEELDHKKVIITRGDQEFQRKKLEFSGILDHFSGFHIVQERSKDIEGIDMLVDDSQKELDRADIPGFLFERDKHSIEDIIEEVAGYETRKSV